ncbi:MAG: suppressor of fused domain protein [Methanomassiliicoccaceae archaeon]|nr:suppressor of fused domain protein [Methanomassiliicoccaceae archaeon]
MTMDLEGYKKKAAEEDDWAPGWDAIDACLGPVYGDQKPRHYGTQMQKRALLGGDQYLDGYSVYESAHGHLHIVTYGMSALYSDPESFGGEFSGWGYEMTIRLPPCAEEDYMWAIDMLANMARYTFTSKRFFEPMQYISAGGYPIKAGSDSKLTGLLVVKDPELQGADTLHGRLDFLQLVGITQPELDMATEGKAQELADSIRKADPFFITDTERADSYTG